MCGALITLNTERLSNAYMEYGAERLFNRIRSRFRVSGVGSVIVQSMVGLEGSGFSRADQKLYMQRFRGGPVFKAHRLCVSLNCGLESNTEEEE